ncbi:Protein of unknown function [Cotesia congregata]|uniref:Peptidase A2 domain-containing protein n=1 Tax=Cotesia congregata TaxID=51543 RepID=A0A8J2MSN8_COTCN|nr:Protein of unknown function [Cotesia congregata]
MPDNDEPYSLRKHGRALFPEGLPPTTRKKFQFTDPRDANATVDSGVGKSLIHPEYTSDEDSEGEPTVKNSNNSDLDNLSANTLIENSGNNSVNLSANNHIDNSGNNSVNLSAINLIDNSGSNSVNLSANTLNDNSENNSVIEQDKVEAEKDAFKNNTDTSVSECFVQNLRNEIDQRMHVCDNSEEALQNAINIERKLNARKELRRAPKEKKSNEEKKKSDEKIKNFSKSVNFTTGSQNKSNKPSTSQNNNKNKNNNYQNFNKCSTKFFSKESGKKQPTDTRCQNIGSIERRRFRVMKVKLNLDLDNLPYAVVGKSSKTGDVIMMLDSGASPNLIKAKYLSDNTKIDLNSIIELHGISNVPVFTLGSVTIKLFDKDAVCHVVSNDMTIPHAGLVGSDFFAKHGAKIDYKNRVLETSLQEKKPTVGTPKTPLQGTVGAPTKKRGRPPKHREKPDEKRIDPSEVMPSLDLDVNVESDATSDDESSSTDSDSSIETTNELKREEGNKATNIIATKDLFQYRHDNMVYFLNGDGQPCDEGARSLKSIDKLLNVGFIDTGQVCWTKKGNTNHFGLVIRGTSGESIIRVRSNIAKCLVKLKGILKDKGITNFLIAFSEFIENVAHDHKTLRIGNTFIDGLEINTTTVRSISLAGSVNSNADCTNSQYSDPFGTWDDVFVIGTARITLRVQEIRIKVSENKVLQLG